MLLINGKHLLPWTEGFTIQFGELWPKNGKDIITFLTHRRIFVIACVYTEVIEGSRTKLYLILILNSLHFPEGQIAEYSDIEKSDADNDLASGTLWSWNLDAEEGWHEKNDSTWNDMLPKNVENQVETTQNQCISSRWGRKAKPTTPVS